MCGSISKTETNIDSKANTMKCVVLKPLPLAIMLSCSATGLAANLKDVLSTRADERMSQAYGRDSVYALSAAPKRMEMAQSHNTKSYNATSVRELSGRRDNQSRDSHPDETPRQYEAAVLAGGSDRIASIGMPQQEMASISPHRDMPGAAYTPEPGAAYTPEQYGSVPNVRGSVQPYRKEAIAEVEASVLPATEEADHRLETDSATQPEDKRGRKSAVGLRPNSNPTAVERPLEAYNEAHQEPDEMAPEGDLPAASATEVSAIEQSDNEQSEPVVRALADQEALIPSEQLIDDSRRSESVSTESTAHATIIEKADSSPAIGVVASGVDADNDGEVSSERSAATATADRPVGGLLEPRISVTAIYEGLPKRSIRMMSQNLSK